MQFLRVCSVLFVFVWCLCSERKWWTPAGLPGFPSLPVQFSQEEKSFGGTDRPFRRKVLCGKIDGVEPGCVFAFLDFIYLFKTSKERQPGVPSIVGQTNM